MTATHILSRWRRVRGALKTYSMWMTLLNIAESGENGITRKQLSLLVRVNPESLTYSLKSLRDAGLVTERLGDRTSKARPATISTITPKGLEFLGLLPS